MKLPKKPNGMFDIERWQVTAEDQRNDPKERTFLKEEDRKLDPYYLLENTRKQCEEELKELDDVEDDDVERARRDLQELKECIEECEKAMQEDRWEFAVRLAISVGGLYRRTKHPPPERRWVTFRLKVGVAAQAA